MRRECDELVFRFSSVLFFFFYLYSTKSFQNEEIIPHTSVAPQSQKRETTNPQHVYYAVVFMITFLFSRVICCFQQEITSEAHICPIAIV